MDVFSFVNCSWNRKPVDVPAPPGLLSGAMGKQKADLIVVDAHAMAYRAHFAMQGQNLTNADGMPTEAIFGFFRMLFRLVLEYEPAMTVVAWDAPGRTFRDDIFKQYKATRNPMPDELRLQIEEIKEMVRSCGFAALEAPGFEADDLIAALARRFGKKKKVILLTGDKDCYQLLNKNVTMLRPAKGVTEFTVIDPRWVETEIGVSVDQIPDYMALVGDSSDNIPGAKGIGPKTAVTLIQKFGGIAKIYKQIEKVEGAARKKLEESKENVEVSLKLATLDQDPPGALELPEEKFLTPDVTRKEVMNLFRDKGFALIHRELTKAAEKRHGPSRAASETEEPSKAEDGQQALGLETGTAGTGGKKAGAPVPNKAPAHLSYVLVQKEADLAALVTELANAKILAVDTETDSELAMHARIVGVSLSDQAGRAWYIPLPPEGAPYAQSGIPLETARPYLQKILGNPSEKIGQNIKYDLVVLRRHGLEMNNITFDTMIASYLLNPNERRHSLDDIADDLLGLTTIKYDEVVGTGRSRLTMDLLPPEQVREYACQDADFALRIHGILSQKLKDEKLDHVLRDVEMRLLPVLAEMEAAGVAIDLPYFQTLSQEYNAKLSGLEKKIYAEVGHHFNINSTKELQVILFEKLKLPSGRKTKTGYSTDQSVLEELRGHHRMVDWLLDHRKYTKLKGTYIDALPLLVHPETGRLHTSFSQAIAATGRLSSNDPNLQNIPVREDLGRAIRRGFIPAKGNVLLSLDYSQIELRIMAHYSRDPALVEAFTKDDLDVHARTAASVFGVNEKDVTADQRSKAKVVNFSIIYGVTDYGLGQSLGIGREEARGYIERFFAAYPGVRKYMDDTVAYAEQHGYVETLTGRRRQIPDINASNRFRKEGAKRTAINTPIQGTSADIIKLAMIQIHDDLAKKKTQSRMILQVHDELLFDVLPSEKEIVQKIALERMQRAMNLSVPLRVDSRFGANWDEAH